MAPKINFGLPEFFETVYMMFEAILKSVCRFCSKYYRLHTRYTHLVIMVILIFWWLQKLILAFLNFLRWFIWCLKPIWKVCVGVRIDNFFIIFSISQFLCFVLLEAILNTLKLVLEFFEHQKLCFWGFLASVCRCV